MSHEHQRHRVSAVCADRSLLAAVSERTLARFAEGKGRYEAVEIDKLKSWRNCEIEYLIEWTTRCPALFGMTKMNNNFTLVDVL